MNRQPVHLTDTANRIGSLLFKQRTKRILNSFQWIFWHFSGNFGVSRVARGLSPPLLTIVEPDLDSFILLHEEVTKVLTGRMAKWRPASKVGDVFSKGADYLKLYGAYCNKHAEFGKRLKELRQSSAAYREFESEVMASVRFPFDLNLSSCCVLILFSTTESLAKNGFRIMVDYAYPTTHAIWNFIEGNISLGRFRA